MYEISLEEEIFETAEVHIFNVGVQKVTGLLGQSQFHYYTTDSLSVLKKKLHLVDKRSSALNPTINSLLQIVVTLAYVDRFTQSSEM